MILVSVTSANVDSIPDDARSMPLTSECGGGLLLFLDKKQYREWIDRFSEKELEEEYECRLEGNDEEALSVIKQLTRIKRLTEHFDSIR